MAETKTIDNLGPDAHLKFIEGTRLLTDEDVQKLFKKSSVATRAEVSTTTPTFPEIISLWEEQKTSTSPFTEPPNFVLSANIFTHLAIPSLGSGKEIIQKLEAIKEDDDSKKRKRGSKEEEEEKDSETKQQRKILTKFVTDYISLNEMLMYIKRKQEEFHKG